MVLRTVRGQLLVTTWGLAAGLILIGVGGALSLTDGFLQRSLRDQLAISLRNFAKFEELTSASLARAVTSVASMPRLRATLNIEGLDDETASFAARDAAALVDADICLLLDADDTVIGSSRRELSPGWPYAAVANVIDLSGVCYTVARGEVTIGNMVIGHVVLGEAIGEEYLEQVAGVTGADAFLVTPHGVKESSVEQEWRDVAKVLADEVLHRPAGEPVPLRVGAEPCVAGWADMSGDLRIVLVRSSVGAAALHEDLLWLIAAGAALAALVSLLVARYVATRIVTPLRDLTEAASELAEGNLEIDAHVSGAHEMQTLASSFNRMAGRIYELLDDVAHQARLVEMEKGARRIEEMRQARDRAQADNAAKSEFLANMSHELRTPMHAILSFSTFGVRRGDSAERAKLVAYFAQIHESADRLMHLLNALLDLSRLDAGKTAIEPGDVDLSAVLGVATREMAAAAEARGQSLELRAPELMHAHVDEARILQVVRNLLGNALKFSPDGAVVEIEATTDGESVTVRVLDRGVGIPDGELEHVFDRFAQSSKTDTGAGGTGLGLAISRELVALHGGELWAEQREGGGSVFAMRLPCRVPDTAPLSAAD